MTAISLETAPQVAAACEQNLAEIARTLSRTLDRPVEASVGELAPYRSSLPPGGYDGAGLVVVVAAGGAAVAAILPSSAGLLPDWVARPDATGESRLATLAQELSLLLLPETVAADSYRAGWAENLDDALRRSGLARGSELSAGGPDDGDDAVALPLMLTTGEHSGALTIVLPVPQPEALFPDGAAAVADTSAANRGAVLGQAAGQNAAVARARDLADLPRLSRSLLRVAVPVSVRLASKQQAVDEIVELGPGSIITFEKSCDDPVELTVGDRPIGLGEVVKVGEHFGIRLDEMVLPAEQFRAIAAQQE